MVVQLMLIYMVTRQVGGDLVVEAPACPPARRAASVTSYVTKGTVNCTNDAVVDCTLALLQDSMQTLHYASSDYMLYDCMNKLDLWAKKLMYSEELQPPHPVAVAAAGPQRLPHMYSTPARMLLFCVLLPIFSFFLFFIYVIFFTGSRTTLPYEQIDYNKKIYT